MCTHVALIRIGAAARAVSSAFCAALERIQGVDTIEFDPGGNCLLVWFDRERITLADLVRQLEDHGAVVAGVAQTRADSQSAQTAIA